MNLPPSVRPRKGGTRPPARERGYDSTWRKIREIALERDGYRCRQCGIVPERLRDLEVDHIVPLRNGGARLDLSNLQTLCRRCHKAKHRRSDERGAVS